MRYDRLGLLIIAATLLVFNLPAGVLAQEENTCIQCHGGLGGRLSAPVPQWKTSVHEANGISCDACHGGDPTEPSMLAMSPERGFIGVPTYTEVPDFCGRCHIGVKEDYMASAHGQALEAGGAQCVICHGNHAVQVATIDLINEQSCSRCHDYERAAQIKEVISSTETLLTKLEKSVASLHRVGIDTERLEEELFSSRNSFRQLFHTVNIDKIKKQQAQFDEELQQTKATIADYQASLGKRKLVGAGVVLLLLLGGCVALLIRRSYHEEE
jgi:hypothetical protein